MEQIEQTALLNRIASSNDELVNCIKLLLQENKKLRENFLEIEKIKINTPSPESKTTKLNMLLNRELIGLKILKK
jgi:hypothetical protein